MGRTVSAETRRISSLILKPANIQTVHNNTSETITCILIFICGILISFCGCVHVLHTFKPTRITYMFFFFFFYPYITVYSCWGWLCWRVYLALTLWSKIQQNQRNFLCVFRISKRKNIVPHLHHSLAKYRNLLFKYTIPVIKLEILWSSSFFPDIDSIMSAQGNCPYRIPVVLCLHI